MARSSKNPFALILVLLVVIGVVMYTAYSSYEGFRSVDCLGVTCNEGEFCQENVCKAIYPPITNQY